jgi:hypothetical protein
MHLLAYDEPHWFTLSPCHRYTGGIILSSDVDPPSNDTDHVIVLTGWGEANSTTAGARARCALVLLAELLAIGLDC